MNAKEQFNQVPLSVERSQRSGQEKTDAVGVRRRAVARARQQARRQRQLARASPTPTGTPHWCRLRADGAAGVVIHCFAGCTRDDVLHALGTTWTIVRAYYEIGEPSDDRDRDRDREPAERCPGRKGKSLEDQAEAHGGVVKRTAYVYRVPPGGPDEPIARKVFRFDFADGTKTIRQKITPEFRETPVLYKQARVENAIAAGKPVYVCEGEKAVDRLNAHFRELAGPGGKLPAAATCFARRLPRLDTTDRRFARRRSRGQDHRRQRRARFPLRPRCPRQP